MNRKITRPVVECSRSECIETTFKISFIILFLSIFLISCKTTEPVKKSAAKVSSCGPVYITNTKKINLLLPECACGIFDGIQLLSGSYGKTSFSLLSYTQIDAIGINLSLFNDFGTDMGNVSFNGERVIFDSAYFPKNLPGEYIICDIQNAFYDSAALEENYRNAGLTFEETLILWETGTPEEIRKIYDGEKLIEEISNHDDTITITNYLRGYEYKLTKVEE